MRNRQVFHLLAAAVIRFENDFIDLTNEDPRERWTDSNLHPFLTALNEAYNIAKVTKEERAAWQQEIGRSFESKNFFGLPINQIRFNNALVMVDSRSVLEVAHLTARNVDHNTASVLDMQRAIHTQTTVIKDQTTVIKVLESRITSMEGMLKILIQRSDISIGIVNDTEQIQHQTDNVHALPNYCATESSVLSWSSLERRLKETTKNPAALFASLFHKQALLSYNIWMTRNKKLDNSWKVPKKSIKLVSGYTRFIKNMIALGGKSGEDFPRPENSLDGLVRWEEAIRIIGNNAYTAAIGLFEKLNPSFTDIRDRIILLDNGSIERKEQK